MDMDTEMRLEHLQDSPLKNDLPLLTNADRKYLRKLKSGNSSSDILTKSEASSPLRSLFRTPSTDSPRIPKVETPLSDNPKKRKPNLQSNDLFFPYPHKAHKTTNMSQSSSYKSMPEVTMSSGHLGLLDLVGQGTARPRERHPYAGDQTGDFIIEPKMEWMIEGSIAGRQSLPLRPRSVQCTQVPVPQEYLESPLINLIVGPSSAVFRMHLELASHRSGKLQKRLKEPSIVRAQGAAMEIVLENVKPEVFKVWKAWAYGNENFHEYDIKSLYQLYFLSTDLKSPELQDLVLDQLRSRYYETDTWPNQERVMHVYRNTAIGSPLRRFMTRSVYYRLMILRDDVGTYFGGSVSDSRFVRDYVDFVQERQCPNGFTDPRLGNGYRPHYHDLKDNTPCTSAALRER